MAFLVDLDQPRARTCPTHLWNIWETADTQPRQEYEFKNFPKIQFLNVISDGKYQAGHFLRRGQTVV